jgi:biotin-dependent carboxylase-like uncharacterized protein
MRQIEIITAGPHTSVQDYGRPGRQALGVPDGGVLDRDAMRMGNALVGNNDGAAVLEVCLGGLSFTLGHAARVALTGTENGRLSIQDSTGFQLDVPSYRAVDLKAGRQVRVNMLTDSNTAVIAISGGINVPLLFGSMATSPNAMIGGLDGRLLRDGDRLDLGEGIISDTPEMQIKPLPSVLSGEHTPIRVVMGPQDQRFTDQAIATLTSHDYRLTPVLNRMGMRLDGPVLEHIDNADISSDGIVTGSIQVPGNGIPIILLADHQTTGGYTKIATVISADLPKLARLRPGQNIRFQAISVEEAEAIAREHEQAKRRQIAAMTPAPPLLDEGALYGLGDTT